MAEPIEIIIRKGTGGIGTGFGEPAFNPKGRDTKFGTEAEDFLSKNKQDGDKAIAAVIAFGIASMKREINYSIAQYGNQTGNYIAQAEMQVAMEGVNNILSVALATAAGFKYGQAPGAIIGAAIATGNIAINYFNQYRTLQTNIAKLDTYANKMRERAGTISSNGSRGTDY